MEENKIEVTEVLVHSQSMLSLGKEMRQIIQKMDSWEYRYDTHDEYFYCEHYGIYPSTGLFDYYFTPGDYPKLSAEEEFSSVNLRSLLIDYDFSAQYAKSVKCEQMVALTEKVRLFIKDTLSDKEDIIETLPDDLKRIVINKILAA